MKSISVGARRASALPIAALIAALGVITAPAASASAATATSASFASGYSSQKNIVAKKKLSVTVNFSGAGSSATVGVALIRGTSTVALTANKTVSISGGKATVSLPLTSAGRTQLAKCSAGVLSVNANSAAIGVAGQSQLTIDATNCLSIPSSIDTTTATRCDITDTSHCMYPFPNDYFTTADSTKSSGKRLNFQLLSMPITVPTLFQGRKYIGTDEFNRFDGFSPGSVLITHVPGLTNDAAFANSGLVNATDLSKYADANQAVVVIDTATGQRWPIWAELGKGYSDATIDKVSATPESAINLIVHPAKNFLDGHHYVVALRGLKDSAGNAISAGDGFRVYRDALVSKKSAVEARRASMEATFASLKTAGIARSNLFLAWDFTVASTRSLSERMLKIRDNAFAQLGDTTMADGVMQGSSPVFHVTSVTETPGDPDTIRQVDGTVEVPCYLTSTNCATGGRFNLGSDGLPTQTPGNVQLAQFRCDVPNSAVDGGGPLEMTLYGHGLFGSINEIGSRNVRQLANSERMLVCGTNFSGMASAGADFGPEDDQATAAGILSDLTNFPKMADRLQQGYLNFLFLGRALAHPSGLTTNAAFRPSSGGNTASYDTGHIAYYGNSQGGIAGGGVTAVSPDIQRSVLYVGAMNYSLLLPRSTDFDEFKPYFYPNYVKLEERPLLFALMQLMWDRGEPNGYANHITSNPLPNTPTKHVLMEMSFGDHQVANIATMVEARTLGLKARQPFLDQGRDTNQSIGTWGLTTLGSMPLDDNALITWDIGPYRSPDSDICKIRSSDTFCGTPSPPLGDSPNRVGSDPHDHNIRTMATLRHQIAEYIKPGGHLVEVCGSAPCYGAGWTGSN